MPLHIRRIDAPLGEATAITGNKAALLKLRKQIDRALAGEAEYPIEEGMYEGVFGEPFQVLVKRARKPDEMRESWPKPEKTTEKWSWAEKAQESKSDEGES